MPYREGEMGPTTPHTVGLILEIDPILLDTPSASDEHQCTAVVQEVP